MSLDEVVALSILRSTVFPTRAGFGVPMFAAYHTITPNQTDFYTSMAGIVSDGFSTAHPFYRMALKAFSQNPRPSRIMLGKRLVGSTMTVTLTPLKTTPGLHYTFTYVDYLGGVHDIDYVNGASETTTTIAAGIVALLTATPVGATCGNSGAVITLASTTAGRLFNLKNLPPLLQLKIKDNTPDPGLAADLNLIYAADSGSWYGMVIDHSGKAETLVAAAWVEATRKLHGAQTSDSEVADNAVTTDVASSLVAAAYARTGIIFAQNELLGYRMVGLMAKMFTTVPGASTWEFQIIAADTVDSLDEGSAIKIRAKNCATYTVLGGLNVTQGVKVGNGEFFDLVPGTDKLFARTQESIFGAMASRSNAGSKIPYTNKGIDFIKGLIQAQLTTAGAEGFLDPDEPMTVTAPKVEDVSAPVRASRVLPDVKFSAIIAGAIQATQIAGTLSFGEG